MSEKPKKEDVIEISVKDVGRIEWIDFVSQCRKDKVKTGKALTDLIITKKK